MSKKVQIDPEQEISGNGHNGSNDGEVLQSIANNLVLLSDRLADLEDRVQQTTSDNNKALLQLVNHFYNTDDKHIKELSNISPLSVRALSTAATMDMIGSEEVKSGRASLVGIAIDNFLRFRRSASGRHLMLGMNALQEQIQSQNEKTDGEEFEAGRE